MKDTGKLWRRGALLGAVACTLFIWHNSMTPATQSAAQSLWVLERLDDLLGWLGLPAVIGHGLLRKLAHMGEFALLGALWEGALRGRSGPGRGWYSVQCACGLCLLTAMTDETIQLFVPGRSGQVTDVWIDFAGACMGVLAVFLLTGLFRRKGNGGAGSI